MTEYWKDGSNISADQWVSISAKQFFCQNNSNYPFSDITYKSSYCRGFSEGSEHIGHTRAFRAKIANILMINQFWYNYTEAQWAYKIGRNGTYSIIDYGLHKNPPVQMII